MTRIISALLGRKRNQPAPEEVEALNRATQVLQWRVDRMTRHGQANESEKVAA